MARLVGSSEQRQVQGANSSLTGIAGLSGRSLFALTFAFVIAPSRPSHLPGALFFFWRP
jgi:hypothetical protein